ncbi:MAG: GNAT family N-acetyltransferase [Acidimicrobiales bacterium]
MRAAPVVRPATAADVPAVGAMLARAFHDDPVSAYLFPSARRRPGGLRTFFGRQMACDLLPHGGVFTTDGCRGAALWAPPGKPQPSRLAVARTVLPVVPYVVGRTFRRSVSFLAQVEAIHPHEPHWYLATLGTEPAEQGRGIGSALLRAVLDRADAEGVRAYLESSKAGNVPFYRRHGFEVSREVRLEGGPPIWAMWREPGAGPAG